MGYEPDGPREEMVYPGQETTVKIEILIPRKRPNGQLTFSTTARRDKLPENPRVLGLIEQSFRDAGLPESGLRVNIRRTRTFPSQRFASACAFR